MTASPPSSDRSSASPRSRSRSRRVAEPAEPVAVPAFFRELSFAWHELPIPLLGALEGDEIRIYIILLQMEDPLGRGDVTPVSIAQIAAAARLSEPRTRKAVESVLEVEIFERLGEKDEPAMYRTLDDFDRTEQIMVDKGWVERTPNGVFSIRRRSKRKTHPRKP